MKQEMLKRHYKDHLKAAVVNCTCMLGEVFELLVSFCFGPLVKSAVTAAASLRLVLVHRVYQPSVEYVALDVSVL